MRDLLANYPLLLSFFMIGTIQLLALISPGPDFAMIVKTALSQTRKTAILTAFGIALGVIVHVTYCILGLAVIITNSIFLFSLIKYVGAFYFIYIGFKGIFAKSESNQILKVHHSSKTLSALTAIQRGFLCNVLNPKATLFFLGLFTLIIKPTTPIFVQVLYGFEIFLITFIWFSALSVIITHRYVKNRMSRFQYYITKCMGLLLVLFGVGIATLQQH